MLVLVTTNLLFLFIKEITGKPLALVVQGTTFWLPFYKRL